jgi:hypothetical protein
MSPQIASLNAAGIVIAVPLISDAFVSKSAWGTSCLRTSALHSSGVITCPDARNFIGVEVSIRRLKPLATLSGDRTSLMLCLVIVVLTLRFAVLVQNSEGAGLVARAAVS